MEDSSDRCNVFTSLIKEHYFMEVQSTQSILTPLTFHIQLNLDAMPSSFQGGLPAWPTPTVTDRGH